MAHSRHLFILIVSAMALLGMSVSCKDKNKKTYCEENPGGCQSVLVAKDFFLFKEGSWWVYEEETSHERDSMYVTQYINSSTTYNFDCRIKSALTDYECHYWPVYRNYISGCGAPSALLQTKCLLIRRGKGKFQDNLGESYVFFVNYKKNEIMNNDSDMNYCPNNTITVGETYDSIQVVQDYFYNVVRIDEACCFQEGKQPTKFYYSKGVGIVRKELIDSNQVWNLVSYHIEP